MPSYPTIVKQFIYSLWVKHLCSSITVFLHLDYLSHDSTNNDDVNACINTAIFHRHILFPLLFSLRGTRQLIHRQDNPIQSNHQVLPTIHIYWSSICFFSTETSPHDESQGKLTGRGSILTAVLSSSSVSFSPVMAAHVLLVLVFYLKFVSSSVSCLQSTNTDYNINQSCSQWNRNVE